MLVIEGIEKAERNVLPVLNNLLENREMHLEDGRFLIPSNRYDKLLKVNQKHFAKFFLVFHSGFSFLLPPFLYFDKKD